MDVQTENAGNNIKRTIKLAMSQRRCIAVLAPRELAELVGWADTISHSLRFARW